jgi:hypothetical protein
VRRSRPADDVIVKTNFSVDHCRGMKISGVRVIYLPRYGHAGVNALRYRCLACADGIVSKTVDGAYQSGPCRVWIRSQSRQHRGTAGAERP